MASEGWLVVGEFARSLRIGLGGALLGLAAVTSCAGKSLPTDGGGSRSTSGGGESRGSESRGGAPAEDPPALGGMSADPPPFAGTTPEAGGTTGGTTTGAAGEAGLGGDNSGPSCAEPACTSGDCSPTPATLAERGDCGEIHMVLRENELFWTEKAADNVLTLSLTTGTLAQVARDQDAATQIAGDASGLYWLVEGDGKPLSSKVVMTPIPYVGSPVPILQVLASSPDEQAFRGLAVAGGKVYYSHGAEIWAVPTTGGDEVLVGKATSTVTAVGVSGSVLVWLTSGGDLEIDDIHEGSQPRKIAHGDLLPGTVTVDGSYVYWADGGSLQRAAHDGTSHAWLASGSTGISSFINDKKNAYFANEGGDLSKVSLASAAQAQGALAPRYLARQQATVSSIAVSGTRVYWATADCKIRSNPICANGL